MKRVSLLLMLCFCASLQAQESGREKDEDVDRKEQEQKTSKGGKTIWLEEKINPTTRLVERLVTPLTSWMEEKVQRDRDSGSGQSPAGAWQPDLSGSPAREPVDAAGLLDRSAIRQRVEAGFAGDVLRIKLLDQRQPLQYRVKHISDAGEIRILYLDARTGEILKPKKR